MASRKDRRQRFGGTSFDADALLYFTAAGITSAAEKTAVNTLITGMKSAGLWTKMDRVYPFSPTSLSASRYCAKTRIAATASNAPTHSSAGVFFNGTTQSFRTGYVPFSSGSSFQQGSAHYSIYTNEINSLGCLFGAADLDNSIYDQIQLVNSGEGTFDVALGSALLTTCPGSSLGGLFILNRTAIDIISVINQGSEFGTAESDQDFGPQGYEIYIGALNENGAFSTPTQMRVQFFTMGGALTTQNTADLTDLVGTYQQAFSRDY
jgi:hypothetical protein